MAASKLEQEFFKIDDDVDNKIQKEIEKNLHEVNQEIRLRIHEESDLFSPYDPDQMMLSEDISSYLSNCYANKHRAALEKYSVHIFSDKPINKEHVKQAIRAYCTQERSNNLHEMKIETYREIALAVLGVLFLALYFYLSRTYEGVWMEVLSIIGWVAVWEAASIAILSRPGLYHTEKIYEKESHAEILIDIVEPTESES